MMDVSPGLSCFGNVGTDVRAFRHAPRPRCFRFLILAQTCCFGVFTVLSFVSVSRSCGHIRS